MHHNNPLNGPETTRPPKLAATAVPCPACHAEAGHRCTSHEGTRTRWSSVHQARRTAWAEQPGTGDAAFEALPEPEQMRARRTRRTAAAPTHPTETNPEETR